MVVAAIHDKRETPSHGKRVVQETGGSLIAKRSL